MEIGKAEVGGVREEKRRREKIRKGKQWEERGGRRAKKVGTSRFTMFFQWFVYWGSKSRLAKAAGAEPSGQMRDEKLHAVVARSTFPSQNVQSTRGSDHFWKLRCRKSARRCGGKHVSKSKCAKHTRFGPFSEVEMSKKWPLLWRKAHFQVKSVKDWRSQTTLGSCDVEKVHAVVAWSTFPSQNVKAPHARTTSWLSDVVLRGRRKGLCTLSKVLKQFQLQLQYNTLHYITLHYTTLRYTTLHNAPLQYTTLHPTTLHCTTLHYTTLHNTTLQLQLQLQAQVQPQTRINYNYRTSTLHYTTLVQHTTLQYIPLRYAPLHYTQLHSATLHYSTTTTTTTTTLRYAMLH